MYIIIFIVFFSQSFQLLQSQNCTGNQFFDNGQCFPCGNNSDSTPSFSQCICWPNHIRRTSEREQYNEPCYAIPSTPLNLTRANTTATTVTLTWLAPLRNDRIFPTMYNVEIITDDCVSTNGKIQCKKVKWAEDLIALNYTKTELVPFTSYILDVCSYNEVTMSDIRSPRDCTDEKIIFTTDKSTPGKMTGKDFSSSSYDDKIIFYFGQLSYFGSDFVSLNLICDNANRTFGVYDKNNISSASITIQKPCGLKLMKCEFYASNDIGKGEHVSKLFPIDSPSCDRTPTESAETSSETIIASVLVCILVAVVIFGGVIFYRWKLRQDKIDQRWRDRLEEANRYTDNLELPFTPRNIYVDPIELRKGFDSYDKAAFIDDDSDYLISVDFDFEFPRDQLDILQRLGEGNFAVVYKAEANGICGCAGKSTVAVKVLKDTADDKDIADFEEELALMKTIVPHKHVVRLLGCCTGKGNNAMIVEFLPMGDLLDVLRNFKTTTPRPGTSVFSEEDFISFASDISSGMNHLANSNIVHRDLACRNVLVTKNRTCKIADLGLARFLDEDGIYRQGKKAKLPIKWMSPESLWNGQASIKSDIWSFGITLWEIITIGASPYPGYKSKDVVSLLRKLYRMPKPSHCSDKIYDIMSDCWQEKPEDRPNFDDLHKLLQQMLNNRDEETYINFEAFDDVTYLAFDNDDVDDDLTTLDIQENKESELKKNGNHSH